MQINYISIETIKFSKWKMFGFEVSGFPDVASVFSLNADRSQKWKERARCH